MQNLACSPRWHMKHRPNRLSLTLPHWQTHSCKCFHFGMIFPLSSFLRLESQAFTAQHVHAGGGILAQSVFNYGPVSTGFWSECGLTDMAVPSNTFNSVKPQHSNWFWVGVNQYVDRDWGKSGLDGSGQLTQVARVVYREICCQHTAGKEVPVHSLPLVVSTGTRLPTRTQLVVNRKIVVFSFSPITTDPKHFWKQSPGQTSWKNSTLQRFESTLTPIFFSFFSSNIFSLVFLTITYRIMKETWRV